MGSHARYCEKKETGRHNEGACNKRNLGTVVGYEPSRPAREQEHEQNHRKHGRTGSGRRVLLYLDQIQGNQKKEDAQWSIEKQGQEICAGEACRLKQLQGNHWCPHNLLYEYENNKRSKAENQAADYPRMSPTKDGRFQKAVHQRC